MSNRPAPRRFVVLYHELPADAARASHWDLMIDVGPALRTWALRDEPTAELTIPAEALADHRLAYLDYQGPISGDRGSVSRWDEGTYELAREAADEVQLALAGRRLRGHASLVCAETGTAHWTFRFASDRSAKSV